MNSHGQHDPAEPNRNGSDAASKLVTQAISTWRNGSAPDALAFLQAHPRVADQKSLVLDLAYEEYCIRKEQGESLTASKFCDKFPDWRRSLAALLDVHEYLDQHPEFVPVEEETKWPHPGNEFLGFEIERKIGSGAFARVYVARDPSLGYRPVALKVSSAGSSEAMTLGRLTHDNIVPVNTVKVDAETGLTVICMPYQGEATLVDLLEAGFKSGGRPQTGDVILSVARKRAMSAVEKVEGPNVEQLKRQSYVDAVAALGIELAGALKYAHSRGVLHRDLKPSNVLLAPDGRPKLLDFNLSWDNELAGARLGGTVPYMSPEQVKSVLLGAATDRRGGIDQRSDLFSLGVVLYELLTGETPYPVLNEPGNGDERREVDELLKRQRNGARPISELNPDVDSSLDGIIAKCLEFDPADRPQTAADLEAVLVRHQQPGSRWKRTLHRRRWTLSIAALSATLVVAGPGLWLASRPPFPVRAYQAGLIRYEQGDWEGAIESWTEAIKADRPTAELLFARAMASIQRGEIELAMADLTSARRLSTSAVILANLAYCNALAGNPQTGVYWSRQSIDNRFVNAAVYNNLGFCNLKRATPEGAIGALDDALEFDAKLAVGYQNRALARLELSASKLPQAVKDIEQALKLAPDNWAIQRDAAQIFAQISILRQEFRARTFQCLQNVLDLGGCIERIRDEKCFDHLRDDPQFAKLLESSKSACVPEPSRVILPYREPVLPKPPDSTKMSRSN